MRKFELLFKLLYWFFRALSEICLALYESLEKVHDYSDAKSKKGKKK